MKLYPNFHDAIRSITSRLMTSSHVVNPGRWQGVDMSARPEAAMREVLFESFQVSTGWIESLDHWRKDIGPNLPWADDHFIKERVSGHPINPGKTWKTWPYGNSADKFRDAHGGQFNHSYAERYWPRYAGKTEEGIIPQEYVENEHLYVGDHHWGIRYRYADLNDLVRHFNEDPNTRQAYLPVWFPEDGSHSDRKPCTLGYHFIQRGGYFHVVYYIRSCDFIRHFRDDCYLTIRLQLWILDRLRELDPTWKHVHPGIFTMHITSLHLFVNDWRQLGGK